MFIFAFTVFLFSEICLGTIPPQIMNSETKKNNTGENQGKVYSAATIGGLTGTFLGGLLFIPKFGVETILCVCVILTTILSIISSEKKNNKFKKILAIILTAAMICSLVPFAMFSAFAVVIASGTFGDDEKDGESKGKTSSTYCWNGSSHDRKPYHKEKRISKIYKFSNTYFCQITMCLISN